MSRPMLSRARCWLGATLFCLATMLVFQASAASAGPGYQLATPSSISLGAEVPIGVAIDQSSQQIYVAELSKSLTSVQPGQVEQLDSTGTPTADSPFTTGGQDLFTAVAVNPVTHGIYAYQGEGQTPVGQKGKSTLSSFSSSGVLGASFFPASSAAGTLAADASGRVYFPNSSAGSVQIFNSSGALEGTLTCSGCPGGSFGKPAAAAFDSAGNLYVVDNAGSGRVVKLAPSAGSYSYSSTLQSGGSPVAIAIDTSTDEAFVGNLVGNKYHVIAYDSTGAAFDDFGAGLVTKALVELATGQLAVNATTHKVYLSNPGGNQLWVFERISSIPVPTASTVAPSPVGQIEATLRATVNPKGHVLTSCNFEYTDHADFLANGYANAETVECPTLVGDRESVSLTAVAKGLDPEASYDYRISIGNYGGSAQGSTQSFQTLPPLPPEAVTGSATMITLTGATLGGTVNPKGGLISNCHFEYLTEAAFQVGGFSGAASKPCLSTPAGNAPVAVLAKPTGLTPGTAYRFRVVATNNSGTTQGGDASFATVAETCAENAALCPPSGGGTTPSPPTSPAPVVTPPTPPAKKPFKCRKGFKKKKVRGKLRCVKVAKRRHRR